MNTKEKLSIQLHSSKTRNQYNHQEYFIQCHLNINQNNRKNKQNKGTKLNKINKEHHQLKDNNLQFNQDKKINKVLNYKENKVWEYLEVEMKINLKSSLLKYKINQLQETNYMYLLQLNQQTINSTKGNTCNTEDNKMHQKDLQSKDI